MSDNIKAGPVAWASPIKWHHDGRAQSEQVIKITRCAQPQHGFTMPLYAYPPAPVAPHGWKLVPVDPTPEMDAAGFDAAEVDGKANGYDSGTHARRGIYQAMLAAAPQPEGLA